MEVITAEYAATLTASKKYQQLDKVMAGIMRMANDGCNYYYAKLSSENIEYLRSLGYTVTESPLSTDELLINW